MLVFTFFCDYCEITVFATFIALSPLNSLVYFIEIQSHIKIKKEKRITNLCLIVFEDSEDKAPEFPVPNEWFRFGIIPSGSTDAIVIW